jgi:hypothetical protein
MDMKRVLLNDHAGPDLPHEFALVDDLAGRPDQDGQNPEGSAADRDHSTSGAELKATKINL